MPDRDRLAVYLCAATLAAMATWVAVQSATLGDLAPMQDRPVGAHGASAHDIVPIRADLLPCERQPPIALAAALRIVDEVGQAIAGLSVRDPHHGDSWTTDGDGSLPAAALAARERLIAEPGWQLLTSPLLALVAGEAASPLIAMPTDLVFGRVVDEVGEPVAAARLRWELDVETAGVSPFRALSLADRWATANEHGHFDFGRVPVGPRTRLHLQHGEFVAATVFAPTPGRPLHVCLTRRRPEPAITGIVRIADGQPGTGALVTAGNWRATTDAAGAFTVPYEPTPGWQLQVVAEGHAPYILRDPPNAVAAERPPVLVTLRGDAAVGGRLLDAAGLPRAGWWVRLVADAECPSSAGSVAPIRTTADGRFALPAIAGGTYRVEAWAADNSAALRSPPVLAPAADLPVDGALLCLPPTVQGTVRGLDGQPLPGVLVGLARPTAWAVRGGLAMHAGGHSFTDAEGRFELASAGVAALELRLDGPSCGELRIPIAAGAADRPLVIAVPAGARVRIANVPPQLAGASWCALDELGAALPLLAATGVHAPRSGSRGLCEGEFDLLPEVVAIAVHRDGSEIGRLHRRGPR